MIEPDLPLHSALTPPSDPAQFDGWITGLENRLARELQTEMRRLLVAALDRYVDTLPAVTAAGDLSMLDGLENVWAAFVTEVVGEYTAGLYLSGSLSAWVAAPGVDAIPIEIAERWVSFVNQHAVDYQRFATNRVVGASDALWAEIRDKTVERLQTGMPREALKQQIEDITGYSEFRADMIARTETIAAYNNGNLEAARELTAVGFGPVAKRWSSVGDDRTRPSHADANGQTVWMDEPFIVGGEYLDAPHDPNAPAAQVVQCRCRVLFLYDDDPEVDELRRKTGRA